MDKQERIVCAAFKFVFSCCEEIVLTVDYEMNDHANDLYSRDYLTGFFKGFITNKNRFVDAKEAEIIAGLAGQFRADCGEYFVDKWCFDHLLEMREKGAAESIDVFAIPFDQSANKNYKKIEIGLGLKPEDLY